MATSPANIPLTCWILFILSVIKHAPGQNVSGKGEIEEQTQYLEPYSRSQINVTVAVWDDSRKKEMEEMKKWNKEFVTSIDSLRLLECNMPLIHLFKNMTNFSQLFETYLIGQKNELERLRGEIEGLESDKSSLKEIVAVEGMNVEECRAKFGKASKELSLVDNERHVIKTQYKKLEKELEAEKNKALRLRKDVEYMKNEIENKNEQLRKFLSMESGLDIFVTWKTSINAVILDVRKKYEEQLRKIQAMYEKKKALEIYAIQVKIREALKEEENNNTKEIDSLRERVSLLDRQLEDKERYRQALDMEYHSYRVSSQNRIRELESELSSVTVVVGRFSTDEITLQSELDTYDMLQEELKQMQELVLDMMSGYCQVKIKKADPPKTAVMLFGSGLQKGRLDAESGTEDKMKSSSTIKEIGPADTTIRDGSVVGEKDQPFESTDTTRSGRNAFQDESVGDPKIHPFGSIETTGAEKPDSITGAQSNV